MENVNQKLIEWVIQLISLADKTLSTEYKSQRTHSRSYVNSELFMELRSSALSFIKHIYGEHHPYFSEFNKEINSSDPSSTKVARGILNAIKKEIEGDKIATLKGLISAEIFSDFIEMAEHLLSEGYKDPAAVMIGSVLEEHLRQLCIKNNIPIEESKNDKMVPRKANVLNNDLGASVYNKLDQKLVLAWLDLRNNAAHGKYNQYTREQVQNMLIGVMEFMGRNSI